MDGASADCPAEPLDSEHPLYILYTSGSTGKPKGILHTTGGYLLGATMTSQLGLRPQGRRHLLVHRRRRLGDRATPTWSTARSPTAPTCVMYEGAPNWPDEGRFWKIVEDYGVSILYTAPTAIRAFMKWGEQFPRRHDLSSLRLLGTVGEPINPEAWMWYHKVIGGGRCPVVDTWWQTETGAIMISPLAGRDADRPGLGHATAARHRARHRHQGRQVSSGPTRGASWSSRQPWPSMLRTLYGDDERYKAQYWCDVPGCYFTGDGARRDENGNYWIMGRVDDVLNVAGHRLSTMEIESALVSHPKVAEAAVVGKPDELQGPGDRRVRHARIGPGAQRGAAAGTARPRRQGDRRAGSSGRDPVHRRPAQDPQRQDHATAAPRRRRRRREHRRHHDARGPHGHGPAAAEGRRRMRAGERIDSR